MADIKAFITHRTHPIRHTLADIKAFITHRTHRIRHTLADIKAFITHQTHQIRHTLHWLILKQKLKFGKILFYATNDKRYDQH